jgi:hypothetical protein
MIGIISSTTLGTRARKVSFWVVHVTALSCLLFVSASGQRVPEGPLTNTAVVKLVKAGFKEKTIIAIINSRPHVFRLDAEQLIQLKHSGVSENIILAMLSLSGDAFANDDDLGDEAFFRGFKKQTDDGSSKNSQGSGADIFGSSGGSNSQSRSRSTRGGNENEGTVTGSATVRIMRPPSESGGAAPKLERTPTLNNDAIVRLVEAGFSEGTIIRRIEESPADFELSPAKLDELRKRRVTEPIIAAMTSAMKDSDDKPNAPLLEREN